MPPYTPIRYTLHTRPWSSSGVTRCRTAWRGLPHEGVRPETNMITSATPSSVVGGEHQVGGGLDDQTDPHESAEAKCRSDSQP